MNQALIDEVRWNYRFMTEADAIEWLDKNVPWWRQKSTSTAAVVLIDKLDDEQEE